MTKKKLAIVGYVVAVHLVLAAVLVSSNFIQKVQWRLGLRWDNKDERTSLFKRNARLDGLVPAGTVVFLGDSITYRIPTAAVAAPSVNYGIGGLASGELLQSLPAYSHSLAGAAAIVLEIGTNDLLDGKARELTENYGKLFAALPKDKPLVVSAIMPIRDVPREAVQAANERARALCETRQRCTFLDTWSAMADAALFEDGTHPNAEGNKRWIALLRPAVAAAVQVGR